MFRIIDYETVSVKISCLVFSLAVTTLLKLWCGCIKCCKFSPLEEFHIFLTPNYATNKLWNRLMRVFKISQLFIKEAVEKGITYCFSFFERPEWVTETSRQPNEKYRKGTWFCILPHLSFSQLLCQTGRPAYYIFGNLKWWEDKKSLLSHECNAV